MEIASTSAKRSETNEIQTNSHVNSKICLSFFFLYRFIALSRVTYAAWISPAIHQKGSTPPGRQLSKWPSPKNNATQQRGYKERNTHTLMQPYIINNYCLFRKATSSSSSWSLSGLFIIILLPYFIISTAHFWFWLATQFCHICLLFSMRDAREWESLWKWKCDWE